MNVLLTAKARLKSLIGRRLSRDFLEKLTEYNIAETELTLAGAKHHRPPGSSWAAIIERGREKLWQEALPDPETPILLLEFGSWQGESMRYLAGLNRHSDSCFLGFDSFEGLPEDWRGMAAERFDQGGALPVVDDPRVRFVRGWFRDSVPPLLDELEELARGKHLVVHYDADLYSSTIFLLFALGSRFKAYDVIFDEFSGHETRALFNYMQATGATARFSHRLDWQGWPQVVAGRLETP
ncbi:hypothetical protein GCM10022280_26610 [Sphingomonas swuensis]|uniref:Methyltransferase n=1 Tax=Sphingomonas swuensis TaxID=977800 RepID=A0ABP7TCZ1_9SPHN